MSGETRWFVSVGGGEPVGPVTLDQLVRGAEAGKIPKDAQVCAEGGSDWAPLSMVLGAAQTTANSRQHQPSPSGAASAPRPPRAASPSSRGRWVIGLVVGGAALAVVLVIGLFFGLRARATDPTRPMGTSTGLDPTARRSLLSGIDKATSWTVERHKRYFWSVSNAADPVGLFSRDQLDDTPAYTSDGVEFKRGFAEFVADVDARKCSGVIAKSWASPPKNEFEKKDLEPLFAKCRAEIQAELDAQRKVVESSPLLVLELLVWRIWDYKFDKETMELSLEADKATPDTWRIWMTASSTVVLPGYGRIGNDCGSVIKLFVSDLFWEAPDGLEAGRTYGLSIPLRSAPAEARQLKPVLEEEAKAGTLHVQVALKPMPFRETGGVCKNVYGGSTPVRPLPAQAVGWRLVGRELAFTEWIAFGEPQAPASLALAKRRSR